MKFDIEKELNRLTNVYRVGMGLVPLDDPNTACEICGHYTCRCHDEPVERHRPTDDEITERLDNQERGDDMRGAK